MGLSYQDSLSRKWRAKNFIREWWITALVSILAGVAVLIAIVGAYQAGFSNGYQASTIDNQFEDNWLVDIGERLANIEAATTFWPCVTEDEIHIGAGDWNGLEWSMYQCVAGDDYARRVSTGTMCLPHETPALHLNVYGRYMVSCDY